MKPYVENQYINQIEGRKFLKRASLSRAGIPPTFPILGDCPRGHNKKLIILIPYSNAFICKALSLSSYHLMFM